MTALVIDDARGKKLGEGAFSEVWLVHRNGEPAAMKTVKAEHCNNPVTARFFRAEARALAALHGTRLPTLYEYGENEGGPYLLMEFLDGEPLASRLRGVPFHVEGLCTLISDCLLAIRDLESLGLVHRDLKPGNIMATEQGYRVFDLGAAMDLDLERNTQEDVATLLYAAPEQLAADSVTFDTRADLYALGAIAYEAAAGRLPFEGGTVAEIVCAKRDGSAVPLSSARPDLPKPLCALVDGLLAPDAGRRPQNSTMALDELQRVVGKRIERSASAGARRDRIARDVRRPLLRRLLRVPYDSGRHRLVRVRGPAGFGKTVLLEQTKTGLQDQCRTLSAECGARQFPLEPIFAAIAAYLAKDEDVRRRVEEEGNELLEIARAVYPPLARESVASPSFGIVDESQLRTLATGLMSCVSGGKTTVLLLDHFEFADRALVEFLLEESTTTWSRSIVFERSNSHRDEHDELSSGTKDSDLELNLQLDPLNESSSQALLLAHLGGLSVESHLATAIRSVTGGAPLLLVSFLRSALRSGAMRFHEGQWRGDEGRLRAIPFDSAHVVYDRLQDLSEEHRRVLAVAATIGSPMTLPDVEAISSEAPGIVVAALRAAERLQILRSVGNEIEFVHDSFEQNFRSEVPLETARSIHVRAAFRFTGRDGYRATLRCAHHYSESGQRDRAAFDALVAAANSAIERFDGRNARRFLDAATEVEIEEPRALGTLHRALGRLEASNRNVGDALKHYRVALDHLTGIECARAHYECAKLQAAHLRLSETRAEATAGLELLGFKPRKGGAFDLLRFLRTAILPPRLPQRVTEVDAPQAEAVRLTSHLLIALGEVTTLESDDMTAVYAMTSVGRLQGKVAPDASTIRDATRLPVILSLLGMHRSAGRWLEFLRRAASEVNHPEAAAAVRLAEAYTVEFIGRDPLKAADLLRRLWVEDSPFLPLWDLRQTSLLMLNHLLVRGRFQVADGYATELIDRLRGLDTPYDYDPYVYSSFLTLVLRPGEESRPLEEFRARVERVAAVSQSLAELARYGLAAIEAFRLAELGEVGAQLDKFLAEIDRLPHPVPRLSSPYLVQVVKAYCRLRQVCADPSSHAIRNYRESIHHKRFVRGAGFAEIRAHREFHVAALYLVEGREHEFRKRVASLQEEIDRLDMPWITHEIYLLEAWHAQRCKREEAVDRYAQLALSVASSLGWRTRENLISQMFGTRKSVAATVAAFRRTMHLKSSDQDALRVVSEVGQAFARVVSPKEVAHIALEKLASVLSAERAVLFWGPNMAESEVLALHAPDHLRSGAVEHSTTVVEKAYASGRSVVVSGTADSATLGAQSALIHNLFSIVASPVVVRGRTLGVLYLDSRLEKYIFDQSNIRLVECVAGQIGAAMETAYAMDVELEKQALEKELAVTGAVQEMLLPESNLSLPSNVSLSATFRPAAVSGGDWWWCETTGDRTRVFVGDVTGHGVGGAMIASAAASAYHAISGESPADAGVLLERVHEVVRSICKGRYGVAISLLEIEAAGRVTWWTAGSPGLFVRQRDGRVAFHVRSTLALGFDEFSVASVSIDAGSLAQAILFTDGLSELENARGRALGRRTIHRALMDLEHADSMSTKRRLDALVRETLGDGAQSDDITFVVVDIDAKGESLRDSSMP